ncbi:hypothetical protein ACC734_40305, partial [Rhizobium ruizarguesonis]
HSAGSGPFTLNLWSPNELVILDANKDYMAGRMGSHPGVSVVVVDGVALDLEAIDYAGGGRRQPVKQKLCRHLVGEI